MRKILLLLTISLAVLACNDSKTESFGYSTESESLEMTPVSNGLSKNMATPNQNIPENRKMIWTGHLEFQVNNVDESTRIISEMVKKSGGFISDLSLTSNTYEISNTIKIRIENEKFQDLITGLKSQSKFIKRVEINSNDVTEEFIDIESRLKTKREVRDRYIKILNTKTGDVKDIIEAEEAIRKITEEIEAKEGRLRYLKDNVKLSTINLRIYQVVEYVSEPKAYVKTFWEKAIQAMDNGWSIIKGFTLFFLTIWPLWVLLILLAVWKRKWVKRKMGN